MLRGQEYLPTLEPDPGNTGEGKHLAKIAFLAGDN